MGRIAGRREPPFHESDLCDGEFCPYHNPSDHKMKDWPKNFRYDAFRFGLVERMCPHGVGHPDPDSVAWLESIRPKNKGYEGIHGCDGCCHA